MIGLNTKQFFFDKKAVRSRVDHDASGAQSVRGVCAADRPQQYPTPQEDQFARQSTE